jgi:tRNA(Arg) A34 adenosine deaminase TadA
MVLFSQEKPMAMHEQRMMALIEFTKASSPVEPYGCSIYDDVGKLLVSVTGNKESPINHAEVLAINECARLFPDIKWDSLTLYTTGEPCCMCASACCWANVKEVVFATDIPFMIDLWKIESPKRAIDIMRDHPKVPNLIGGVCAEESNKMFVERKEVFARACQEKRWI